MRVEALEWCTWDDRSRPRSHPDGSRSGSCASRGARRPYARARVWVALAYLLVLVATVAAVGRIADAVGRKLLYVYGFGVFTCPPTATTRRGLDFGSRCCRWRSGQPRRSPAGSSTAWVPAP